MGFIKHLFKVFITAHAGIPNPLIAQLFLRNDLRLRPSQAAAKKGNIQNDSA
jgi:hypothetical protein